MSGERHGDLFSDYFGMARCSVSGNDRRAGRFSLGTVASSHFARGTLLIADLSEFFQGMT